jgi:hypothetical protein
MGGKDGWLFSEVINFNALKAKNSADNFT